MILDSGDRREFETGAVRDMAEGKGRFDLVPMGVVHLLMPGDGFISGINNYMDIGSQLCLQDAADYVMRNLFPSKYHALIELSKHFENGMKKYGQDNWKKGINTRSYLDSSVRHYCKHKAGFDDEPHATACLWNLVCAIWTCQHKPELNDYWKDEEEE